MPSRWWLSSHSHTSWTVPTHSLSWTCIEIPSAGIFSITTNVSSQYPWKGHSVTAVLGDSGSFKALGWNSFLLEDFWRRNTISFSEFVSLLDCIQFFFCSSFFLLPFFLSVLLCSSSSLFLSTSQKMDSAPAGDRCPTTVPLLSFFSFSFWMSLLSFFSSVSLIVSVPFSSASIFLFLQSSLFLLCSSSSFLLYLHFLSLPFLSFFFVPFLSSCFLFSSIFL